MFASDGQENEMYGELHGRSAAHETYQCAAWEDDGADDTSGSEGSEEESSEESGSDEEPPTGEEAEAEAEQEIEGDFECATFLFLRKALS